MQYKLNQVEGALFRLLGEPSDSGALPGSVPTFFRTRIRRLLELDRVWAKSHHHVETGGALAFHDNLPEGKGKDAGYSPANVFRLALGLELLNAGFQQKEVVEKIASMREALDRTYDRAKATRSTLGSTSFVDATSVVLPKVPSTRNPEVETSDPTIFLIVWQMDGWDRIEHAAGSEDDEHEIVDGFTKLQMRLRAIFGGRTNSLHIVELSGIVARTQEFLDQQPILKRGR